MPRALPFAIALGLSLSFAASALASPSYPAVIEEEWRLTYTPACTTCHASDSGGRGTVVTYFGIELQSLGLTAQNDASLVEALREDKAQQIDSDGSGTSDYDDLVAGRDPNSGPGPSGGGPVRPLHGCAAAPGHDSEGSAALVLALALLWAARRRQRSSRCESGLRSTA